MMQEWLVDQVKAAEAHGDKRRAALKKKEDALAYVKDVKARVARCFGPMPERTPLNAKITGVLERDGYKIEKVLYESRPQFLVSANLYVPTKHNGKCPAVLGVCGHSYNGKAEDAYQSFAQGLARMGYVVLIIDPIGQGERLQYIKQDEKKGLMSRYGGGTGEHIRMGNQMNLMGEFIGSWMVWDGMRGVDYLLTREEVDPKHIGVTGNSGGGTQTTWLCGMDERLTMAAPACFVTTFRRNAENELPADTEQCPPGALAEGLDHSDFLACMAPKPVIICTQEKDYFDARGGKVAFERLKKLYTLLGKPENIQLQVGPDPHGYTQPNREAMYSFFNRVTKVSDATTEPTLTLEKEADLLAAPKGQVSELGSRSVMSFTREHKSAIATDLEKDVRHVLRLPTEINVPDYRILRPAGGRGYPAKGVANYAVESEPGVFALVTRLNDQQLYSRLPLGNKTAVLYVAHQSADNDLRFDPWVKDLVSKHADAAFFAMDVRGVGDSRPNTCGVGSYLGHYGSDYFYAAHGVMLDRPVLGQRTHDVLAVIALLKEAGHENITLAGRGWGALPAAFAALLCADVKQVKLKNALTSYADVIKEEDYKWPYALLPRGIVKSFDLPSIYDALKPKHLDQVEPWGALDGMNP
ncbi:MAG: acetylxylan esterase [Verrucomicrobiaceae bacterium]|nr:acetylxylan esterase [Verrucomicrobiaceae bacterium]